MIDEQKIQAAMDEINRQRERYNAGGAIGPEHKDYLPPVTDVVVITHEHGYRCMDELIVLPAEYFDGLSQRRQKKLLKGGIIQERRQP